MVQPLNESQQTQTFSVDHENVLPEHYRLIELIGRGGMAEVYLAEDRRLGRKVAIKFLNPEFRRDPDRVRRFRQEARSASALNHPNILIIHDIGDRGGVQFIVSEFVEGETVGTRIAQGKLSFSEAVDVAIQSASALSAAHSAGIVHRDIKPDNVMIRNDGVVKVLDFGLAKARGFSTANGTEFDALTLDSGSTSPGLIVGTPQYMSPEQARGKELDGRTDIFSLGIIIFEMVTRHSPFASGSFADTMAAILTKEPRKIGEFVLDAPARLAALVEKCLRKDRDERFSTMVEVEAELKQLRSELIASPRDTAVVDPVKSDHTQIRPTNQHSIRKFVSSTFQRPSSTAASIILVAAGLLVGGWWSWGRISTIATAPSLMRTVPITSWSGSAGEIVSSASFSPNGRMVAFAIRGDKATEIWVKPVVGGDAVQVTKDGVQNNYPIWSPDGEQIAFLSNRGNSWGIWRIPFTGGNLTKVSTGLHPSARTTFWSEKGGIYFQAGSELYKVSQENSVSKQITDLSERGLAVGIVEISDDEAAVAYAVAEESGSKVKIRSLATGDEREIAATADQIDYIAWHPNGRSVFCSFTVEGSLQVVEASADGSWTAQRSNGDLNFLVHDVAANGSVLYSTLTETSDLWKVETDSGRESVVANAVASEFWPDVSKDASIAYEIVSHVERPDAGSINAIIPPSDPPTVRAVSPDGLVPSWSNSGEWIAFFRKGDKRLEVWKSRPDGIDLSRVSTTEAVYPPYSMSPYLLDTTSPLSWSPNDSRLAFAARQDGGVKVWVANTDGSLPGRQLSNFEGLQLNPIWTPDGGSIVFLSLTGSSPSAPERVYRIVKTDLRSGDTQVIFEAREPLRLLGYSKDGASLLFAKRANNTDHSPIGDAVGIYSLVLVNAEPKKLKSLDAVYFRNIHLSADGNIVGFVTRVDSKTAIASLRLDDGLIKEHLTINDPKVLISSLGMSHDGSFIVFGKQTRTNLLSMLTN